jgi:hypothetical protein
VEFQIGRHNYNEKWFGFAARCLKDMILKRLLNHFQTSNPSKSMSFLDEGKVTYLTTNRHTCKHMEKVKPRELKVNGVFVLLEVRSGFEPL